MKHQMIDHIFFWCRFPDPRPRKDGTPLAAAGAGAGTLVPHKVRSFILLVAALWEK